MSGTTACVLGMQGRRWMVANVGDSRAVMITQSAGGAARGVDISGGSTVVIDATDEEGGAISGLRPSSEEIPPPSSSSSLAAGSALSGASGVSSGASARRSGIGGGGDDDIRHLQSRPLSSDHKPSRPDERARVSRQPAAHIASEAALGISGGGDDKLYVCRVHNGSIRYGVLFTRSIGDADAHAHLGLIATPEVTRGTIGGGEVAVVLATDGVWDTLSQEDGERSDRQIDRHNDNHSSYRPPIL